MSQLPAKTYPKFYEAFEAKVTSYQDEIKRMDENQDLYAVVQEAAEQQAEFLSRFSEVDIKLYPTGVTLFINVGDTPVSPEEVRELTFAIGTEVVRRRLHHDGEPSVYNYGRIQYGWSIKRKEDRTSRIDLDLYFGYSPVNSKWLDVYKRVEHYTATNYVLKWRDKPRTSLEYTTTGYMDGKPLSDEVQF
jgi:hypothetical protein